jgi:hypothetical protein
MLAASLASSLVFVSSLSSAEQWQISRPLPEGKQSPLSAAPLQKQAAHDKELAEKYPVFFQRIEVEGVRDPDKRAPPPQTTEQRFADALNDGNPELIAGRTYDGYYYDGTLFWGRDPLSFAWKNVTHWFGH